MKMVRSGGASRFLSCIPKAFDLCVYGGQLVASGFNCRERHKVRVWSHSARLWKQDDVLSTDMVNTGQELEYYHSSTRYRSFRSVLPVVILVAKNYNTKPRDTLTQLGKDCPPISVSFLGLSEHFRAVRKAANIPQ